ncbi:hypothetical protein [Pseudomonas oryzihabitans]|uniref:hypothetical protein n=1 Tax=Pseudomonas oryzihabitans TaxID=47885 RepID=UPI00289E8ACF|nr:hypothetical protein [Pseudomonas oryzihabitans]
MPEIKKSDLFYEDYSWTAVSGDDPTKTKEDSDRFSRKEGYEVLALLNRLKGKNNGDLTVETRQICEWMIHERLPGNIQGRRNVINWIAQNFREMKSDFPH